MARDRSGETEVMSEEKKQKARRVNGKRKLRPGVMDGIEIEWTTAEVAKYLSLSEALIYDLCHKRQIPHRRIDLPGRVRPKYRFRKSEIDIWREAHSTVVKL
jgi:excisionase family DNA binding protein